MDLKLGDVSDVATARRIDDNYDALCSRAEDQFKTFFANFSSRDVRMLETSNGMEASVTFQPGLRDVVDDQNFARLFAGGPHDTAIAEEDDRVIYSLVFASPDGIIEPRKARHYFDLAFGLALVGFALFSVYEIAVYFDA